MIETNTLISDFDSKYRNMNEEIEEDKLGVTTPINKTNVVSGEKLRKIQQQTLNDTREYLSKTFGPMGSNTKIVKGTNQADVDSSYSKDGLKVLKSIINSAPIEASIVEELVDITRHVEHEVGDGTTSTVILSSFIFNKLMLIEQQLNIPPFELVRLFQNVVGKIKSKILERTQEITLDDVYNIALVSTNGNIEVSKNIRNIYEEFGFNVEITAGISNDSNSMIKVYDGLTITEGMSDPVFINNKSNNTSEIHNAKIYHFVDPIDTMEMIALFESILNHNIYEPLNNEEELIPTVITCPRLSKDLSASLKMLSNNLYQYDQANAESAKPPILIITNVVASDEVIMDDIANLCGCKSIRKYIDPKIYQKDVESGNAPTVDNVFDFAGEAELVISDSKKTKFINPAHMKVMDDEGNIKEDPIYTAMVNFLETEIKAASDSNDKELGLLKKRLSALKANMVDYLVGGVTVSERDSIKDLVEDAVKNCKSASLYGAGYAANFEGLLASYNVATGSDVSDIELDIARGIFSAYVDTTKVLYGTVSNDIDDIMNHINKSIETGIPYDISSGILPPIDSTSGSNIKCSIMLDINILDTISKIITMMSTCNQCLLMASHLNVY